MGIGTVTRLSWELGRPSLACGLRKPVERAGPITRQGEVVGSRDGVGGGRSTGDPADNTTVGEGRASASSMQMRTRRSLVSARRGLVPPAAPAGRVSAR